MGMRGFSVDAGRRGVRLLVVGLTLGAGACAAEPLDDDDEGVVQTEGALRAPAASWEALGGDLNPAPGQSLSDPSLLRASLAHPVVAFSAFDPVTGSKQSFVLRWKRGGWSQLGTPLAGTGPFVALDEDGDCDGGLAGRLYACFVPDGAGPVVQRWDGDTWSPLGGDVSVETGYQRTRYSVSGCDGMVLDRPGRPTITWTADTGSKSDYPYVARWNQRDQIWTGLGPDTVGEVGQRATSAALAFGGDHRAYLMTHKPGGSYGGDLTTRLWRWDRSASDWIQLGADLLATDYPTIVTRHHDVYLALRDDASGAISVMRWRQDAWSSLPSPGVGVSPALAFTSSGSLVIAFVDEGVPATLRVARLHRGAWHEVGAGVATFDQKFPGHLELGFDDRDRPIVAWVESDLELHDAIFVKRYGDSLP